MNRMNGFSFIELLTVLGIMGVILSLSIPLYTQHIIKGRRLEATAMLNKLAVALEQYYTFHHTYKDVSLSTLDIDETIAQQHYQLMIASATPYEYVLQAKPLNNQTSDTLCGTLILNSLGEKSITGSGHWLECWR